jgi:hypothetical protein
MTLSKFIVSATAAAFVNAVEPNPPTWDSQRVKVLTPGQKNAQAIVDKIYAENGGHSPAFHGQWSNDRYAIFLTPGTHDININVGYYTTVQGLGATPDDVSVGDLISDNGDFDMTGGALANFWRGAENLSVNHDITWSVSQAAPLRRMHIAGKLNLSQYNKGNLGQGYASGGFAADLQVDDEVNVCSQQQFFLRNTEMTNFVGYAWNYVHVGNTNTPPAHCSNQGGFANTIIESTPTMAEKPYLVLGKNGKYTLMKPYLETKKIGSTKNWENAEAIDFSKVFVAHETDSAATINAKLAEGLNVVFQPGNYNLTDTIKVTKANTVLLGVGLATLISTTGKPCITVAPVDGVRVAGFLLQAGEVNAPTLFQVGKVGYAGKASNPVVVSDIYARVGGTNLEGNVSADTMVNIDSGNVLVDNAWLWRADHDAQGLVYAGRNPVKNGIVVNGDNVTTYGLAAEHTLEDLTVWNGNHGTSFFYQSEYPYDVTQDYADKDYAGYKIGDSVTSHTAWGTGVYSFFRDNEVVMNSGIKAPARKGVVINNALTVKLNGKGSIKHIVDNTGEQVTKNGEPKYECFFESKDPVQEAQDIVESFIN